MNKFYVDDFFRHYIWEPDGNDYVLDDNLDKVFAIVDGNRVTLSASAYDGYILHFMDEKQNEFSINFAAESLNKYSKDCENYVEKRILDMTNETGRCELLTMHLPKKVLLDRVGLSLRNSNIAFNSLKTIIANFSESTCLHKLTVRKFITSGL